MTGTKTRTRCLAARRTDGIPGVRSAVPLAS